MKKVITVSVTYVVQDRTDPDDADRKQYRNPERALEVMDSDNFRSCFVSTVEEAVSEVRKEVEDALGLSGGVVLGAAEITTEQG